MRLRILAYHAIADLSDDPVLAEYGVPPRLFAAQLDALTGAGWNFVDLDAALAALAGEGSLPRRAVLLSFDDAYVDLLKVAAPIMAERGLSGVVFAVAGQIGGTNEWDNRKRLTSIDLLDADELLEVAAQGIEVGSHTTSHRPLTKVSAAELEEEIVGAANRLEQAGLPRPRTFSYPYGDWSPTIVEAARAAGYRASFTVDCGIATEKTDPQALPRIEVHASDTPSRLRLKLLSAGWPASLRDSFLRLTRGRPSARGGSAGAELEGE
jgi:peptidoglycan/xylan/chitin deacetylase (PgdA/CDA1 family)